MNPGDGCQRRSNGCGLCGNTSVWCWFIIGRQFAAGDPAADRPLPIEEQDRLSGIRGDQVTEAGNGRNIPALQYSAEAAWRTE